MNNKECKEIENYRDNELDRLNQVANKVDKIRLIQIIDSLSSLSNSMKWATQQGIIFEAGLIKLCSNITQNHDEKPKISTQSSVPHNTEMSELKLKVLTKLKENGKILLHAKLENTQIELGEDGMVHIIFNSPVDTFTKTSLLKDESKQAIKEAVTSSVGKEVSVKFDNLRGKEE